ncbi:MAG: hypothetical protein ACI9ND_001136 [Yoonia sp.]|jgi:hypothetical protein
MDDAPDTLPPHLTYLKRLVTVLTVVMIAGFILMITMLVIRLNRDPLPLPDRITLPEGTNAYSFTQGKDWFGVVTDDDQILVYDRGTNALIQTIDVATP